MTNRKILFFRIIITSLTLIVTSQLAIAQENEKESIIAAIATKNEVHEMFVGRFMDVSDQYFRYKKLTNLCNEEELLDLAFNHENTVVRCYASWGLIDKKYEYLPKILNTFLKKDSMVWNVGSVIIPRNISSVFYHHYWQDIEIYNRADDKILAQLDSIILYSDNSPWLLKTRAFENRIYTANYMKRIEVLAFEEEYYQAMKYLFDWHRGSYHNQLEKSLSSFCQKTDFEGNVDIYYEVIEMLLSLKTIPTKLVALEKLKKDNFWRNVEEEWFLKLLDRYYIYDIEDIEENIKELEAYIEEHQLKRF